MVFPFIFVASGFVAGVLFSFIVFPAKRKPAEPVKPVEKKMLTIDGKLVEVTEPVELTVPYEVIKREMKERTLARSGIVAGKKITVSGNHNEGITFDVLNLLIDGFQYGERDERGKIKESRYMPYGEIATQVTSVS